MGAVREETVATGLIDSRGLAPARKLIQCQNNHGVEPIGFAESMAFIPCKPLFVLCVAPIEYLQRHTLQHAHLRLCWNDFSQPEF